MPIVRPFKAFRYQQDRADLCESICFPYDVIHGKNMDRLSACATNAIHVEYSKALYTGADMYSKAKDTWNLWKSSSIVRQDDTPAVYIYFQYIPLDGKLYVRKGIFVEVQLEDPKTGSILRHEETIASHKQDRLDLIRSIGINTSPIFGLFREEEQVTCAIDQCTKNTPDIDFKDVLGISHKVWICTQPSVIQKIQECISKEPIMIADGHHRYETAWDYHQEVQANASANAGLTERAASTLFYLTSLDDEVLVFPTHRISRSLNKLTWLKLIQRIEDSSMFDLTEVSMDERMDIQNTSYFLLRSKYKQYKVTRKKMNSQVMLVDLHKFLLFDSKKEDYTYVHICQDALNTVQKIDTWCALVPNISLRDMYKIAKNKGLMPQKSTYFYPKIPAGIVFRSLRS